MEASKKKKGRVIPKTRVAIATTTTVQRKTRCFDAHEFRHQPMAQFMQKRARQENERVNVIGGAFTVGEQVEEGDDSACRSTVEYEKKPEQKQEDEAKSQQSIHEA